MSVSNIGIKVADGTFYPILDRDAGGRKKLILTTVNDSQSNVQIDLYEGQDDMSSANRYVGSLLIEDLVSGPAGEAEVELLVGMESDGNLMAQAQDLRSGESQSLNVSLESLDEDAIYDMPDFELDNEFEPWTDEPQDSLSDEEFETSTFESEILNEPEPEPEPDPDYIEPPRRKPLLLALFIIFGIAAVAALAILLFKIFEGPVIPPLEAQGSTPTEIVSEQSADGEASTGDAKATAETESDTPTVAATPSVTTPSSAPAAEGGEFIGGVWYWISWGDTLWDISSSFYRNPWQYGRIAEENSIRNPDLIYAGSKIFIPKK